MQTGPTVEAKANIGQWFGCALPSDFGNWRKEYGYLRESVGVLDKNYRAYLDFTGPDRVRYLNAILTNNLKDLALNHGVVSLFLSAQGQIQAEIETYTYAERIFAISFASIRERLIPAIEKYIIMDDVTLADNTDNFSSLALEGPRAGECLLALGGPDISQFANLETRDLSLCGCPSRMIRRSPGGAAAVDVIVPRQYSGQLWTILDAVARQHGGGPAGYTALNALRLEQGIPWFSYDFGEKQIPHEAGLQDSHISYAKGCYTGQEIVERVRSRGHVNRMRVLLSVQASEPPAAGTALFADGKEIGHVTRSAVSPALNALIAMAYVRREKSGVGSIVELAAAGSGETASVIAPPLL
jgi:folate-binding protein YgfZ